MEYFKNTVYNSAALKGFCQSHKGVKLPSLPDTLQVQLAIFASLAWCETSESMLLGLHDLAWTSNVLATRTKFPQPSSCCEFIFRDVITQFEQIKQKFPNQKTLYVYLWCNFEITHWKSHGLNCFGQIIYVQHTYQYIAKLSVRPWNMVKWHSRKWNVYTQKNTLYASSTIPKRNLILGVLVISNF